MNSAASPSAEMALRGTADAHDALVSYVLRVEARGEDENTLRWVSFAAKVAWLAHPGRFVDQRLEAVALRIGQRLATGADPAAAGTRQAGTPRHVLHVATLVYEIGGHTRLIENWMRKDAASVHSLVLLNQDGHDVPHELSRLIAARGGELQMLPSMCSLLDRARWLRRTAQSGYDLVVLHHHPDDVVPTVALAVPDCPPVAIMNHADHVFWIGTSVADVVIDFREYGARMSRERRGARRSMTLPLPIDVKPSVASRAEARAALGIPADEIMLLSMGAGYKYAPTPSRNFLGTMRRVLAENPAARLYVIGPNPADLATAEGMVPDRIELLGPVADPSLYQAAADLYLEGFPLNSYTALLETAIRAICPVLMYAPTPPLDLSNDAALSGLVTASQDEDDYVARIGGLIADPIGRARIGEAVAERIVRIHGNDMARSALEPIYEMVSPMVHQPFMPPPAGSSATVEDLDRIQFKRANGMRSILIDSMPGSLPHLGILDALRVLAISLRHGDTRPSLLHLRNWIGILRRSASARR